jgi:hypothetical protein
LHLNSVFSKLGLFEKLRRSKTTLCREHKELSRVKIPNVER